MDFLDPRQRQAHKIRLVIGYGLMGIVILLMATILVYGVSGYGINTKTGDIIQNGLLFVDSKPGGASIFLNGKDNHSSTAARLVLPAASYELTIKKAGYRDWQRKFTLSENSVNRYTYPLLFPIAPASKTLRVYPSEPPVLSASPDRKWLLVQVPPVDFAKISFDVYETTKLDQPPTTLAFPTGLLSNTDQPNGSLSVIEWAADNDHFLVRHSFSGGQEFIVVSRVDPTQSFNVNRLLNSNPTQVSLRNKKTDQLYIYSQNESLLSLADVSKISIQPLLKHVLAFKSHEANLFSYITDQNVATGQVTARIWESGKSYPLYTFAAGSKYLIDATQFQGHWYYVAGSDQASRINVFKDPLNGLKNPEVNRAIPILSLSGNGSSSLSFSANVRFVSIQAGQKFSVYDIETDSRYQFTLAAALSGPMRWLDGHRWIGQSGGAMLVMDYDSTNQQVLTPTIRTDGGYLDKNSNFLLTLAQVTGSPSVALQATDLRAGADLPKQ
ncbi:PEGA domain-containing protein [Candidatus Saccharibacteria bacterium]|nr:PEGA domain-containing protein [Candidatus Saccharibacteria bacterium]